MPLSTTEDQTTNTATNTVEIYPSPGIHQLNITSDNKYSYNIQYLNHGNIQMDHKIIFSTFYSLHKFINDHDNENSIKR